MNFSSRRSPVLARRGMVATSQPLAAVAGLRVLMEGGSAADAAVTTAAMLNVVEPMSTGIGGDCFALFFDANGGQVSALNGSGRAPASFTFAEARRLGLKEIPLTGALPVTVPGTVSGWEALVDAFGTMSLGECPTPAIAISPNMRNPVNRLRSILPDSCPVAERPNRKSPSQWRMLMFTDVSSTKSWPIEVTLPGLTVASIPGVVSGAAT